MKKILFLALAISTFGAVNAQEGFKPAGGENNLEFQLCPLGGNPISIGGIRYRKFTSATSALRLNVFLGFTNKTKVDQNADQTAKLLELKTKTSGMTISVKPGIEKHFAGTAKLSPYVGAELDITMATSKEVVDGQDATPALFTTTTTGKDGFMVIGLNGVVGFDYYIAQGLYLGAEMGLGFGMKNKSTIKESTTLSGAPTVADKKQGSELNFGPNVVSQIRLGFLF